MLLDITCDRFVDKRIPFKKGLNVVLGTNRGDNGIGKSSLLLIIDFVFGGSTFPKFGASTIKELGHHEYNATFQFGEEKFYIKRKTDSLEQVSFCDESFTIVRTVSKKKYLDWLKEKYTPELNDISFRDFVGLFSRIWGKDNLKDPTQPLQSATKEPLSDGVNRLIRIFNKYKDISSLKEEKDQKVAQKNAVHNLSDTPFLPAIGRKVYKENKSRIDELQANVTSIRDELAKYATNIREIVNQEIFKLKIEKDSLLNEKYELDCTIEVLQKNLAATKFIANHELEKLITIIPNINVGRLQKIESFHQNISRNLSDEIKDSLLIREAELLEIQERLQEIDELIKNKLSSVESPNEIVDRIFDIASELQQKSEQNSIFEQTEQLKQAIKELEEQIEKSESLILGSIAFDINLYLRELTERFYGKTHTPPHIDLSVKKYEYIIEGNTGTGVSYYGLLAFDFSIFTLTNLPILIHDSPLFKNIENPISAKLFELYTTFEKQSFIAVDEITKYGKEIELLFSQNAVVTLSKDHYLFGYAWSNKENSNAE